MVGVSARRTSSAHRISTVLTLPSLSSLPSSLILSPRLQPRSTERVPISPPAHALYRGRGLLGRRLDHPDPIYSRPHRAIHKTSSSHPGSSQPYLCSTSRCTNLQAFSSLIQASAHRLRPRRRRRQTHVVSSNHLDQSSIGGLPQPSLSVCTLDELLGNSVCLQLSLLCPQNYPVSQSIRRRPIVESALYIHSRLSCFKLAECWLDWDDLDLPTLESIVL